MRVLRWAPYLLLALAVGLGGWLAWDTVAAVREANEPAPVALETTTSAAVTSTSTTSTSTSTSTTTTIPTSTLDGIVLFTSDTCPECPFLRVRLQDLAGEVPLWLRPPEEGITMLPTVLVQYAGDVKGRWEGQVAVNSAEAITAFAGERWEAWVVAGDTTTTATTGVHHLTFVYDGRTVQPGLVTCGEPGYDRTWEPCLLAGAYVRSYADDDGMLVGVFDFAPVEWGGQGMEVCFRMVSNADGTMLTTWLEGNTLLGDPLSPGMGRYEWADAADVIDALIPGAVYPMDVPTSVGGGMPSPCTGFCVELVEDVERTAALVSVLSGDSAVLPDVCPYVGLLAVPGHYPEP